jgi:hypothetical protein
MAAADQACARKIEELVLRIGEMEDPEGRETARQLMEAILELHGNGLERMMEIASGESPALVRKFAGDDLVSALLVLHGLHPDDLETRVRHALGKWHGSAELLNEFEGVVRVRLSGCGCGMKEAVEAAIREAAPDAAEIVVEESFAPVGFVPLSALGMSVSGAD